MGLPLIAALRAAKAPVVGHHVLAVVAKASWLQTLVRLHCGAQAGLAFLFFSDGCLVGNVGHRKKPGTETGQGGRSRWRQLKSGFPFDALKGAKSTQTQHAGQQDHQGLVVDGW